MGEHSQVLTSRLMLPVHPAPCSGWLLVLFHSTESAAPLLTWHLKLTDSPWRTVAARGSTVATAWLATAETEIRGQVWDKCVHVITFAANH